MADETSLLIGQLMGKVDEIGKHLGRQDEDHIRRHAEIAGRIDRVEARVATIESSRAAEANQAKGEKRAYGAMYAIGGAVLTGIGAVFGPDAVEAVKKVLGHG